MSADSFGSDMTKAEQHGYLTGVKDLTLNRWDGDDVMPPAEFMQHAKDWHNGYNKAYADRLGHHAYQFNSED